MVILWPCLWSSCGLSERQQEEAPDRGYKRLRDETRAVASPHSAPHDSKDRDHTRGPFGEPQTTDGDEGTEVETEKGAKQRKRAQHREDEGVG